MPINVGLLVLGAVCIGLIITGSILEVNTQKKVSSLRKIDPTASFTFEPDACQIVDSSITSVTKRMSTRDGGSNGSVRTEDYCEDKVFYTFVWNDAPSVNLTSRTAVTTRNRRHITFAMGTEPRDELCIVNDSNGLNPYQGFLKEDTPFVCDGLCAAGTIVDCWRPISTSTTSSSNESQELDEIDIEWANCGNSQCLKLVDPAFELEEYIYDAGFPIGILLIAFGVLLAIFGACLRIFICNNSKDTSEKFPSGGMGGTY